MKCDMARKIPNRNGKISPHEDFICQHMCNHYRRILNAKKVVDTSPPYSYKARLPGKKASLTNGTNKPKENRNLSPAMTDRSLSTNSYKASSWGTESFTSNSRYHTNCIPSEPTPPSRKQTLNDMKLINQITYDTKNGPAAYCDQNWTGTKSQDTNKKNNVAFDVTTDKRERITPTSKRPASVKISNESNEKPRFRTQKASSSVMSKETQSYTSLAPKCRPRILKTQAVSKLRSLRVYYPPRRKKKRETETSWEVSNESGVRVADNKTFELCICSSNQGDFKKPADTVKEQTSSRDSAYNGGVSSLPESRSPTPDHRNKVACLCGTPASVRNKAIEICNYLNDGEVKSSGSDVEASPSPQKIKLGDEEALRKMKEDALYVKFIQDITVEVLEKGLFTNKAIKKVMRKHIVNNLPTLDKDRMIKEVENLRIQLGVPEDKCLLEIEETNEESTSGAIKAYPVVSDSAFVLPENLNADQAEEKKIAKSISEVLQANEIIEECDCVDVDEDDADDLVSVVKVTKKLRERITSSDSSSEEGNPNRKKRPKVAKFSKTVPKTSGAFFSSSSDSEGKVAAFNRQVRKNQRVEKSWNGSCICDEKKNRSVTFDGIGRQGGKHIRLVMCSDDFPKSERKIKAKND